MNIALWVVAGILAVAFLMSGLAKLTQPYEKTHEKMEWAGDFSPGTIKFIGAMEALAAIGLIVPPLVDVADILVPIAATGLVVVMIGAIATHARRGGEQQFIFVNLMLGLGAAFVAVGRFWLEPF